MARLLKLLSKRMYPAGILYTAFKAVSASNHDLRVDVDWLAFMLKRPSRILSVGFTQKGVCSSRWAPVRVSLKSEKRDKNIQQSGRYGTRKYYAGILFHLDRPRSLELAAQILPT